VEDQHELARAEEAFRKAFALNDELALAHHFYTALQTDLGRSLDAMERLLTRAHTHHNDVNLLAALVQACRYCDLLEASVAAHSQAMRLDPLIRTSVGYTYLRLGDYARALEHCGPTDGYIRVPALMALGRGQEVIDLPGGEHGHQPGTSLAAYEVFVAPLWRAIAGRAWRRSNEYWNSRRSIRAIPRHVFAWLRIWRGWAISIER
jgi:hypothetical protein